MILYTQKIIFEVYLHYVYLPLETLCIYSLTVRYDFLTVPRFFILTDQWQLSWDVIGTMRTERNSC